MVTSHSAVPPSHNCNISVSFNSQMSHNKQRTHSFIDVEMRVQVSPMSDLSILDTCNNCSYKLQQRELFERDVRINVFVSEASRIYLPQK